MVYDRNLGFTLIHHLVILQGRKMAVLAWFSIIEMETRGAGFKRGTLRGIVLQRTSLLGEN